MVDGLYAALVTLGVVPIIRCPKVHANPPLTDPHLQCQRPAPLPAAPCNRHIRQHTPWRTQVSCPVGVSMQVAHTLSNHLVMFCRQGGAAEAVAAQLQERLRAALKSRNNPFAEASPGLASQLGGRPLLALFDRTFELRWVLLSTYLIVRCCITCAAVMCQPCIL